MPRGRDSGGSAGHHLTCIRDQQRRPRRRRASNVGLLTVEENGVNYFLCSGFYAGARKGDPGTGVFLTAGHCVAWLPTSDNNTPDQLRVTFDPTVTIEFDPEFGLNTVKATTWHDEGDRLRPAVRP